MRKKNKTTKEHVNTTTEDDGGHHHQIQRQKPKIQCNQKNLAKCKTLFYKS